MRRRLSPRRRRPKPKRRSSTSARCRRSIRSAPIPTSARSCKRAFPPRSGMRRFAARGRPIRRSAITSDRTRISGKAPARGACPDLASSIPTLDIKKLLAEMFGEAEQEPRGATETVSPADQSTRADNSGSAAPAASEAAQGKSQPSAAQDTDPLLQRDENVASHHDDAAARSSCFEAAAPRRGDAGMSRGIIPRLFDYL